MGLPNSYGLKFLRHNPKSGVYSYVRMLAVDISPFVVGTILLPWTTRVTKLTGKCVIKISLGVVTEVVVRDRWTSVHAQVNEIVNCATLRVQEKTRNSKSLTELNELNSSSISILAQQVRSDILKQHDQELMNPNESSNLATVALRVLKNTSVNSKDLRADANAFARKLALDGAKAIIVKRDFSSL